MQIYIKFKNAVRRPDVVESTNGGAGDGNHVWAAWSLLLTPRRPAPIIMPYDIGLISCGF